LAAARVFLLIIVRCPRKAQPFRLSTLSQFVRRERVGWEARREP
jgi:hypothetical protein